MREIALMKTEPFRIIFIFQLIMCTDNSRACSYQPYSFPSTLQQTTKVVRHSYDSECMVAVVEVVVVVVRLVEEEEEVGVEWWRGGEVATHRWSEWVEEGRVVRSPVTRVKNPPGIADMHAGDSEGEGLETENGRGLVSLIEVKRS